MREQIKDCTLWSGSFLRSVHLSHSVGRCCKGMKNKRGGAHTLSEIWPACQIAKFRCLWGRRLHLSLVPISQ